LIEIRIIVFNFLYQTVSKIIINMTINCSKLDLALELSTFGLLRTHDNTLQGLQRITLVDIRKFHENKEFVKLAKYWMMRNIFSSIVILIIIFETV
jgi:hypothetical protein